MIAVVERALQLVSSLQPLWLTRGRIQEGLAWFDAVLGERPLDYPLEDAIANMRVIDACFRSARNGGWERP